MQEKEHVYHGIAAVTGQDDDINRRGVISHADAPILGFILTETVRKKKKTVKLCYM